MAAGDAMAKVDNGALGKEAVLFAFCMGFLLTRQLAERSNDNSTSSIVARSSTAAPPSSDRKVHPLRHDTLNIRDLDPMMRDWLQVLAWGNGVAVPSDIHRGKAGAAKQATTGTPNLAH